MLAAAASLITLAATGRAHAQTDWEKTDILRGRLAPRSDPATPPPASAPRSAIPDRAPVRARLDDRDVEVMIDPLRFVDMRIQFAFDSAELDGTARRSLSVLGRLLQTDLRPYRYLIAGHTDATGGLDHNIALSMRRAIAVRRHLIEAYGVEPGRLFVAGFGPTALRDPRRPTDAINRRVEVVLVTGTAG
jgi:outer membrane protein OmpA-like peptidoglycan-associated protein